MWKVLLKVLVKVCLLFTAVLGKSCQYMFHKLWVLVLTIISKSIVIYPLQISQHFDVYVNTSMVDVQ